MHSLIYKNLHNKTLPTLFFQVLTSFLKTLFLDKIITQKVVVCVMFYVSAYRYKRKRFNSLLLNLEE